MLQKRVQEKKGEGVAAGLEGAICGRSHLYYSLWPANNCNRSESRKRGKEQKRASGALKKEEKSPVVSFGANKIQRKKAYKKCQTAIRGQRRERERKRARLSPALPSPEYRIQFCPPIPTSASRFPSKAAEVEDGGVAARNLHSVRLAPMHVGMGLRNLWPRRVPQWCAVHRPSPPPRRMCQSYLYSQKRGWGLGGIIPSLGSP